MKRKLARCQSDGMIVPAKLPVPDDPTLYLFPSQMLPLGCNRLRCTKCKALVRQQPGLKMGEERANPTKAYATEDWSTIPQFVEARTTRLYCCTCDIWNVVNEEFLSRDEDDDPRSPKPPWSCSGHPPIAFPYELDGIAIDAGTDVAELTRAVLAETLIPPDATKQEKAFPHVWVAKLYTLLDSMDDDGLESAPDAKAVSMGILQALDADEPNTREEALSVYQQLPDALGFAEVVKRYRSAPERFVGVKGRSKRFPFLEDMFALAIRSRIEHLQFKGERLDAPLVDTLVSSLTSAARRVADSDEEAKPTLALWVKLLAPATICSASPFAARAKDIAGADPGLALPLLEALHAARAVKLLDAAEQLAKVEGIDRKALAAFGKRVGGQVMAALRFDE